jgi:hypothetical protein
MDPIRREDLRGDPIPMVGIPAVVGMHMVGIRTGRITAGGIPTDTMDMVGIPAGRIHPGRISTSAEALPGLSERGGEQRILTTIRITRRGLS